tara:strand:+ start:4615 stop:5583 length:969 start_codon:yes stop_codon:yes gene_type:complete
MVKKKWILIGLYITLLSGCSSFDGLYSSNDVENSESISITNKLLTNRSAACSDYVGRYTSYVKDVATNTYYNGDLTISTDNETCVFKSNSIPNHDFNNGNSSFVNAIKEVNETVTINQSPFLATTTTDLTLQRNNAILLNGVKLDLLAAGCFGIADGKTGCNDSDSNKAWRYDPMSTLNNFGTDSHNAHTQPDGAYHYHGNPKALFEESNPIVESPVIGFAADGFPIYGSYILDNGALRKVKSSYQLKSYARQAKGTEENGDFPGSIYNGQYRDDYEYIENLGDLDECNGMTHNGSYGYYVTDSYPWVLNCFKGTPDPSFTK